MAGNGAAETDDSQEDKEGPEQDGTDSGVRTSDTLNDDDDDLFPDDIPQTPYPVHSSTLGNRAPRDEMDDSPPDEADYDLFDQMMQHV
jgi:hypothetical protein